MKIPTVEKSSGPRRITAALAILACAGLSSCADGPYYGNQAYSQPAYRSTAYYGTQGYGSSGYYDSYRSSSGYYPTMQPGYYPQHWNYQPY